MILRGMASPMKAVLVLLVIVSLALGGCGHSAKSDYTPTFTSQPRGQGNCSRIFFQIFPLQSAIALSDTSR